MFSWQLDDELALLFLQPDMASELFALCNDNREYLSQWLPWPPLIQRPVDSALFIRSAIEKFARELLAVKDSLEAGLATENPNVDSLKSGTELTLKQLVAAFEKSGLKEVNPVGEKFDPNFHQAISMIEAEQEPNTVVSVLQKGYTLTDRVLRPALVVVAKAKA